MPWNWDIIWRMLFVIAYTWLICSWIHNERRKNTEEHLRNIIKTQEQQLRYFRALSNKGNHE